jgi:hypothetical protein
MKLAMPCLDLAFMYKGNKRKGRPGRILKRESNSGRYAEALAARGVSIIHNKGEQSKNA